MVKMLGDFHILTSPDLIKIAVWRGKTVSNMIKHIIQNMISVMVFMVVLYPCLRR